jgi:hypothetical protein
VPRYRQPKRNQDERGVHQRLPPTRLSGSNEGTRVPGGPTQAVADETSWLLSFRSIGDERQAALPVSGRRRCRRTPQVTTLTHDRTSIRLDSGGAARCPDCSNASGVERWCPLSKPQNCPHRPTPDRGHGRCAIGPARNESCSGGSMGRGCRIRSRLSLGPRRA